MVWEIWVYFCLVYVYDCLDNILLWFFMLGEGGCFDCDFVVMGDG